MGTHKKRHFKENSIINIPTKEEIKKHSKKESIEDKVANILEKISTLSSCYADATDNKTFEKCERLKYKL